MKKRLWLVYGMDFLLVALLFLLTIPVYTQRIPSTLELNAQKRLPDRGIDWARVEATGRDLQLGGNAPTLQAYHQVLDTLQQVPGVRNVTSHMHLRLISPYTMSINWRDGLLEANGFLPDEDSYHRVSELITDTHETNVVGELRIAAGQPPEWVNMLLTLFAQLPKLERAHASITDQQISLSGKAEYSATVDAISQALMAFKQQGYELDLHLIAADSAARLCQQRFEELLKTPIVFDSGNSTINDTSHPLLEQLSETAMLCPDARITIAGHTDNRGSSSSNQRLSQQRARSIATWLIEEGIDSNRIITMGYGADKPVADNAVEAGRAKNRRIELIVQGK